MSGQQVKIASRIVSYDVIIIKSTMSNGTGVVEVFLATLDTGNPIFLILAML